jgi:hypothetical protein
MQYFGLQTSARRKAGSGRKRGFKAQRLICSERRGRKGAREKEGTLAERGAICPVGLHWASVQIAIFNVLKGAAM